MRRLEAGNVPSGSARQAGGPRPAGVGDCGPAGTESGLGRCWAGAPKLSQSARRAGPFPPRQPVPERGSVALSVGVSLSPCAWGRRVPPVYLWEPSGWLWAPAGGPGFEGVMCPSFWRVSVAGRVHSAIPRVASCAWNEGSDGPQLLGAGGGLRLPLRQPRCRQVKEYWSVGEGTGWK